MNNQELRPGNICRDHLTKALLRVDTVSPDKVIYRVIDRTKHPLPDGWQAEPQPITADILHQMGFVDKGIYPGEDHIFTWEHSEKDVRVVIMVAHKRVDVGRKTGSNYFIMHNVHFHQLQNIIFDITGEFLSL